MSDLLGFQAYTDGPVGSKSTNTQDRILITVPYPEHTKFEAYNNQNARVVRVSANVLPTFPQHWRDMASGL